MTKLFLLRRAMLLFVMLSGLSLWAQVETGTITGSIADPRNLAIPNAEVTIKRCHGSGESCAHKRDRAFSISTLEAGRLPGECDGFRV
jgi:hypothetical protein